MSKIKKGISPLMLLVIILSVAIVMIGGFFIKYRADAQRIDDSLTQNVMQLQSDLFNLRTCYEENIKPCTAQVIKSYNKEHGLYPQ